MGESAFRDAEWRSRGCDNTSGSRLVSSGLSVVCWTSLYLHKQINIANSLRFTHKHLLRTSPKIPENTSKTELCHPPTPSSANKSSAYTKVARSLHPATTLQLNIPDLLFMGREYPQGYDYYRTRLHKAFSSQKHLEDEAKIMDGIKRAEFVKKGDFPCLL
jgi:hypothetical protein